MAQNFFPNLFVVTFWFVSQLHCFPYVMCFVSQFLLCKSHFMYCCHWKCIKCVYLCIIYKNIGEYNLRSYVPTMSEILKMLDIIGLHVFNYFSYSIQGLYIYIYIYMHHYIKKLYVSWKKTMCDMKFWNLQNAITIGKHWNKYNDKWIRAWIFMLLL